MNDQVDIQGRNLRELYQYLMKHRVHSIIEDAGEQHAREALVITSLTHKEVY